MEVKILESIGHPNIVQLKEVFDTPKLYYMVLELMTGGELFDRIVEKSKFTEAEAAAAVRAVAEALDYCHKQGIVHRDLKPENLLYGDKTDNAVLKVADFGLAKLSQGAEAELMTTACGTPGYVAPEILEGRGYVGGACDCWSLGVITYILLVSELGGAVVWAVLRWSPVCVFTPFPFPPPVRVPPILR